MIQLERHAEGVILPVRTQPGARRNELRSVERAALKVSVTQVAEKGKANRALIALLCKQLGLRKSQLELLTGATSPHKRFLVRHLQPDELLARINRCLAG